MPKDSQHGFTLIELSITVAIVAILAAIAIPAYQGYIIRSQVSEGLTLVGGFKPAIVEYYTERGSWPALADLGGAVPGSGKYVNQVTVNAGGVLQVTYGTASTMAVLNGAVLTLVPYVNGDTVTWQCGLASAPPGVIATGAAPGGTTLLPSQLPASCRS